MRPRVVVRAPSRPPAIMSRVWGWSEKPIRPHLRYPFGTANVQCSASSYYCGLRVVFMDPQPRFAGADSRAGRRIARLVYVFIVYAYVPCSTLLSL